MPADSPAKPEPASAETLPPPLFGVLVVAGLVVTAAGLKQASDIVGPFFLTLTIVIAVYPLNSWLVSRKVPQLVASVLTMIAVYLLIIVVLGSVVWSLTRLATTLPDYSAKFTQLYNDSSGWLAGFGLSTEVLQNAASKVDLASFAGVAQGAVRSVTSGLGLLALIAALVFFLVFDAAGFRGRIDQIRAARPRIAEGLVDFSEGTRKYWIVTTVFGFIVAVIDVIALLIIGVPLAFTWGVLAFVTNYIPNIGFLIGMLPPAMIALLDGGVGDEHRRPHLLHGDQHRGADLDPAAVHRRRRRGQPDRGVPVVDLLVLPARGARGAAGHSGDQVRQVADGRPLRHRAVVRGAAQLQDETRRAAGLAGTRPRKPGKTLGRRRLSGRRSAAVRG